MVLPDSKKLLAKITEKWPSKVLSIAVAIIIFVFHRMSGLQERFFSVPLHLEINNDLVPSSPYPRNIRVNLRGDANSIFPIIEDDVEAYVDLTTFQQPGSYKASVQIRKRGTALEADSLEIGVDPLQISITLDTKISKTVPLTPDFDGYLEEGYEMVSYTLNPSRIIIDGPTGLINSVEELSTEGIDLGNRNSDFSAQVHITNPNPLLVIRGDGMAEFKGFVREFIMIRSFSGLPITALALREDLAADLLIETGSIRIGGTQQVLENFNPAQIILTVDCAAVQGPGTYRLPLSAAVPEGITVSSLEPAELQLIIGPAGDSEDEEEE